MIDSLLQKLCFLPIVLFSLSLHELSHGLAAYKLGDNTAKAFGRLTLNPFAHLDIMGTIAMLFFGFGWAKPVPVNFANLKYKRLGPAMVAIAGPFSNFLLALAAVIINLLCFSAGIELHPFFHDYVIYTIVINVTLAAFNLIPIPPLDGSKIVLSFLPFKWQFKVYRYEPYIQILFFILLYWGALDPLINLMAGLVTSLLLKAQNLLILLFL